MTSQIGLIKAHDLNRPADAADALVQVSSIFGSADFSVHVCHIGDDPNSAIAFRLCRFQSGRRALFQPEEQQSRGCGLRFSESYPGTSGLDGGWGMAASGWRGRRSGTAVLLRRGGAAA